MKKVKVRRCPACGGYGECMGSLGQLTWYRCEDCGGEFEEVKRRRRRKPKDAEWQRERAMEAGMAFGVDGYNDVYGY